MDLGTWVGPPASCGLRTGKRGDSGLEEAESRLLDLKRIRPVRERMVKPEIERRGIIVFVEDVGEVLVVSSLGV